MADVRYRTMTAAARAARDAEDDFLGHVFACILAVGLDEAAREATTLASTTGLEPATLAALLADRFPDLDPESLPLGAGTPRGPDFEEEVLIDLLAAHVRPDLAHEGARLAPMIARRAMRPDHLWQDLGLFDRSELGRLLALVFPTLHAGNTANMRWKKYFYRRLCEAEGFALCSAPSCAVCTDFSDCFGAEDGESRMAERRRAIDRAGTALAAE